MLTVGANGELKLRGNSNIKVLINGIPSGIMAKNLKEALKMIPASSIVSVEVITNPSAKYEAEGAGGVINIITKKKLKGTSGSLIYPEEIWNNPVILL
jgi:outer membrane receptor for ferrienterochelin and colicin